MFRHLTRKPFAVRFLGGGQGLKLQPYGGPASWTSISTDPPIIATLLPDTPLPTIIANHRRRPHRIQALHALTDLHHHLQHVPLHGLLADLERVDSAAHYLHRLTTLWPARIAQTPGEPLTTDMHHLLAEWHQTGEAVLLAQPVSGSSPEATPTCSTGSGTDNTSPASTSNSRADPVFDAADLTEHIRARQIDDVTWPTSSPHPGVTAALMPTFHAAQRLCALWWTAALWKQHTTRPTEPPTRPRTHPAEGDTVNWDGRSAA
jgi:hypothetical protein